MQVSLHGARALRTRSRHRVPLVHVSHSPPETIQVTSDASIGNTGCSKDPFLNPSYVLLPNTPIVLFNEFTHRLTSPPVKTFQYFSFVKTCFGSQHSFKLGISVVRTLLQPYPLHYKVTFAFSYILCPLNLPPSSRLGYH